jgi:Fe-S-cluster formation regulator IscX/YfhJ
VPWDPEALALALRERHPDAEPAEVDAATLAEWIATCGGDPEDDVLAGAVLVAWEAAL